MRTGVILVNSNPMLEKAIIDSCISKPNISILETVPDLENLIIAITRLKPRVIIITDDIDESPFEIIIKIMESTPIPCLLIHSKEHEFDDTLAYALDYGIVDVIEVEFIKRKLRFPQIIPIRVSILGKLKVKRFLVQIEQVNTSKSDFVKPKLKPRKPVSKTVLEDENMDSRLILNSFGGKKISSNSIIVIAASTGGPKMIVDLITQFPRKFPPV
ncbi:MAG: hypothetical protein ACC656_07700, partial [Candidatus Heimdallarchaeota archaeon]